LVIENREGRAFTFYTNADRLEREMMEIAPEDRRSIREFTNAIRYAASINMSVDRPEELYNIIDKLAMIGKLPVLRFMQKWSRKSVREFVAGLKSPYLKEMLPLVFGLDAPMIMLIMMLGWQHGKLAGYLIGGALPLVQSMEKRYKDLGGEVQYQSRVEKILVENSKAVGIRLADGSEHRADWIISAADGRTTIFDMLDGRYVDKDIDDRYENPKLFQPLVYIALGVDGMVEELPASCGGLTYPLDRPLFIAGKEQKVLCVRSYCFDPTLAPEGKTLLIVQYETDYDYWKNLKENPDRYTKEKKRITAEVIAGLEQRFQGITERIEMTDTATPLTWERYTGNWRGAYEGWLFDAESFTSSMKKTLPGLKNFYMAGQWVNPGGGIPTAVMSGNHTIQLICRKDRKKFVTSEP